MKFFLLLIVTSSATLAASAADWVKGFSNTLHSFKPSNPTRFVDWGGLESVYSRQKFNEATDTLQLGSVSFEEATKKLEDELDANLSDNLSDNPLIHYGFKYKTYTGWLVGLAKGEDDRGFLVALYLRRIYYDKLFEELLLKEEDHGFLGEATQHVLDAFFTAEAQPDFFRLRLLVEWGRLNYLKLVDRAIAEGRDSLVDALIKDPLFAVESIWENIKPGTKFPDLVGPHLYEYAMKEIGTSVDDKTTANAMLINELGRSDLNLLRIMALLDKTDQVAHEYALSDAMSFEGNVRRFMVAAVLARGKWKNCDLKILQKKTKKDWRLKALCENNIRIRELLAEKYEALAKKYRGNNDEPKDHQRDEVYEQFKLWNVGFWDIDN